MTMNTPKALFAHEMSDIYDAEQRILKMLPLMAQEAANPTVRDVLQNHEQETRQQITNLEQCFQMLGVQPENITCYAVVGLKQEHDTFIKENPAPDILTMFDLGAAAKTEHYEIAAYEDLIEQATLMGQQQCVQLLRQNLSQEQEMAQRVTTIAHQLGQKIVQQA
jgi:ferritin-like metal-binding protein YciE